MHARMQIKICGVTNVDDALMAADAGADWIGLNFHPASKRFIDTAMARAIAEALPPSVEAVGVFVNRPVAEVAAIASNIGLKIVQLHGDEPVDHVAMLHPLRVIRAFRLGTVQDAAVMVAYASHVETLGVRLEAVLVDAHVAGQYGGTGLTIRESVRKLLRDREHGLRLILAGGLTPENVVEMASQVRPWMVDVAGGVETTPGRKDKSRVRDFVRAIREFDRIRSLEGVPIPRSDETRNDV